MHCHSFEWICTKYGKWNPYTFRMVMGISERRSRSRARAPRALGTPLQITTDCAYLTSRAQN